MKLRHHVRQEDSGLFYSTLELVEEEERQGHQVSVMEPSTGKILYGFNGADVPDVHLIHSQLHHSAYHDKVPKFMWQHGEPLGSVGNGISMRAIVDLARSCEALICMRQEEHPVWDAIRKCYVVPKGIDLNRFVIQEPAPEPLKGNPAILYYENWRGQRNPLMLCIAMQELVKEFPEARLHLYNCPGGKMYDTFRELINHCRWGTFIASIKSAEKDVPTLLNRADIVVSCLYPLYARGIEAFGCGRAFIGPGYAEHDYPYTCKLEPKSIGEAIRRCWLGPFEGGKSREFAHAYFRAWAEKHHDVSDTVKKSVDIYQRYLDVSER